MAQVASNHSSDWQGLGVSILHRLIADTLLDAPNLPAPKYVRDISEVVRGLELGDEAGRDATGQTGSGGRFELAALVMPATVEHIRAISSRGERMPAKSTYFYPKLLSGLVINPLE
jgi:Tfp pilus assembly pilus retraction ATPase PilT